MGVIQNGTFLSSHFSGRVLGGKIALGSISPVGIRGRVGLRRFNNNDSFPPGMGLNTSYPALLSGFMAGFSRPSSTTFGSIKGKLKLSGFDSGFAIVFGRLNLGSQIKGFSISSSSTFGSIKGKLKLSGFIRIGASPSSVDIAGEILDVQLIDGVSVRKALMLILAANAGDMEIAGTTYRFKNPQRTKNRITATVDSSGRDVTVIDVT